jgi:hypothetical protein
MPRRSSRRSSRVSEAQRLELAARLASIDFRQLREAAESQALDALKDVPIGSLHEIVADAAIGRKTRRGGASGRAKRDATEGPARQRAKLKAIFQAVKLQEQQPTVSDRRLADLVGAAANLPPNTIRTWIRQARATGQLPSNRRARIARG